LTVASAIPLRFNPDCPKTSTIAINTIGAWMAKLLIDSSRLSLVLPYFSSILEKKGGKGHFRRLLCTQLFPTLTLALNGLLRQILEGLYLEGAQLLEVLMLDCLLHQNKLPFAMVHLRQPHSGEQIAEVLAAL
jgi:hypothetical protein